MTIRTRHGCAAEQAYYAAEADRITWMRVLCSGYRPVPGVPSGTGT